jgi:hypothetical protein
MRDAIPIEVAPPPGLPWPVVTAAVPLLYAWIAWSWWGEVRLQLLALPEGPGAYGAHGVDAMAMAAVATRIPGVLTEAILYTLGWRLRGFRLPYWRFVCWVATLSTLDLLGFSLRRAAEDAPQGLHLLGVALAGSAIPGAPAFHPSGSAAAFGNFGLLTLLRVIMTAWAEARGIGRPLGGPLVVTCAAWLATRLVAWWSVDLLRGMSPVP